jgi:patatin-like phospholipase/acyl hydrolase
MIDQKPETNRDSLGSNYKFKILSLDGGGIRGAFTAAFLEGIESILRDAGKLEEHESVASYFDLIAGTSTGGIIATSLAMGSDAAAILKMYQNHGGKIFSRQKRGWIRKTCQFLPNRIIKWFGHDTDALIRPKYATEPLRNAIQECLGDQTLRSAKHRLIVPSARTTVGRPIVFRTPHIPNQIRDLDLSATDVILATSAAPTFFPPYRISNSVQPGQFVDGGVWANHPGLLALTDALRISDLKDNDKNQCGIPNFDRSQILLMSIGTGITPSSFNVDSKSSGLLRWMPKLVDYLLTSQSQGTHYILRHLIPEANYHRIDFFHDGWKLDDASRLQMLIDIGHSEARNMFVRIPSVFFEDRATKFIPFSSNSLPDNVVETPNKHIED